MALSRLALLIGKSSGGRTTNLERGFLRSPTRAGPLPSVLQARPRQRGEACEYPIQKQSPRALSRTWAALVSFPRLIAAPHSSLCHRTSRTIRQTGHTETQQGFLPLTSSSSSNTLPYPARSSLPTRAARSLRHLARRIVINQRRTSSLTADCAYRSPGRSRSPDSKQRGC